jgi:hypothetical protein
MSSQTDGNGIAPDMHEARGEWLSVVSLVFFVIATTVFDVRFIVTQYFVQSAIFVPGLISIQGYILWYYFNRFRPNRKMFTIYGPEIADSYSWLFVLAMVGTSVVALIGVYLIRFGL